MLPLSKTPPTRFPKRLIQEAEALWWVAKVKPRQEKALAFDCIERNMEYYLPMYTKAQRRKDNNKLRKSMLCLFPGYFCYNVSAERRQEIFSTNRIVNIVEVKSQKKFIKELEQIYHTIDLGVAIEPLPLADVKPGQRVEVIAGPLMGICGTMLKLHSGSKLILSVDMLGRAVISVDSSMVKPIDE
ncbi:MAG: hypothetical protein JW795_14645 [Chitinivibrionales bacterium]|nr:hypothetical protein [Chitinivibrionales bacterium]